ncbi:MAG TPA: sporulation protein YabP [Bacillota bacterium]|nr:sporulation protein YabP [Bacillota bacterium]
MEGVKRTGEGLPVTQHQLNMTNRNLLGVDGVVNMASYDNEKVILETSAGVLEIKGEKLHIQQLNLEQGKVVLDGEITALAYSSENAGKRSRNFFSKLVK